MIELVIVLCFAPPDFESKFGPCPQNMPWTIYRTGVPSIEQCPAAEKAAIANGTVTQMVAELVTQWKAQGATITPEHRAMVGMYCGDADTHRAI